MVSTISLLPLASAAVAAALTVLALLSAGRRSRQRSLFAALNVAVAAWCLGFFFEVNYDIASMTGADTTAFALDRQSGVVGPPARVARERLRRRRCGCCSPPTGPAARGGSPAGASRWYAHPAIFSVLTMATNPLHRLAISPGVGTATLGPLAMLDQTMAFVLIVAGTWMIGVSALRDPEPRARASGLRIVAAAAVPVAGAVVFFARAAIGAPMSVNLPPGMFVVLELVLAYEVLFAGLTDVGPVLGPIDGQLGAGAVIIVDEKPHRGAVHAGSRRCVPEAGEGRGPR